MRDNISMIFLNERNKEFANSPQISLGELIKQIEQIGIERSNGDDRHVYYDFCSAIPTTLNSFRGYYEELALGYVHQGQMTAKDLLSKLKTAIGKSFTGWKGGNFIMTESTPIWVANSGHVDFTGIVGVKQSKYGSIIIETTYLNYD